MLALLAVNIAGALAFGVLYAAAGARVLAQAAFLGALVVLFAGVTALWAHVERTRGRGRDALGRTGRVAGALALTVFAVPALALMPLFALREKLPAEAGLDDVIRPALVLVLISLALVVLANAAGICVVVGAAAWRRFSGPRAS